MVESIAPGCFCAGRGDAAFAASLRRARHAGLWHGRLPSQTAAAGIAGPIAAHGLAGRGCRRPTLSLTLITALNPNRKAQTTERGTLRRSAGCSERRILQRRLYGCVELSCAASIELHWHVGRPPSSSDGCAASHCVPGTLTEVNFPAISAIKANAAAAHEQAGICAPQPLLCFANGHVGAASLHGEFCEANSTAWGTVLAPHACRDACAASDVRSGRAPPPRPPRSLSVTTVC